MCATWLSWHQASSDPSCSSVRPRFVTVPALGVPTSRPATCLLAQQWPSACRLAELCSWPAVGLAHLGIQMPAYIADPPSNTSMVSRRRRRRPAEQVALVCMPLRCCLCNMVQRHLQPSGPGLTLQLCTHAPPHTVVRYPRRSMHHRLAWRWSTQQACHCEQRQGNHHSIRRGSVQGGGSQVYHTLG
jgi:hypothetical protein